MRVDHVPSPRTVTLRRRVVIADDDPLIRALLTDLLRLDGHVVSEAADGEELLFYIVRAFAFDPGGAGIDLIISDYRMPFCSGLDVLRQLREAHRTTPVLLLTADDDPSLRPRVEALGGRLLEKPFTFEALRAAIREALAPRPGR